MNERPKSKGRGCLYGCLTVLILLVIGAIVGIFVVRHFIKSTIATYTDTSATALPQVQMSPEEVKSVQKRQADFFDGLKRKRPVPPLVLTAADINALIDGTGTNGLKGKVYVSIDDDRIKGQVSVPLDGLSVGALKGRYLNGTVAFNIAMREGALDVRAASVEVRGKPAPAALMKRLAGRNLAQDVIKDPNAAAVIRQIRDITVTNGTVIIEPKLAE